MTGYSPGRLRTDLPASEPGGAVLGDVDEGEGAVLSGHDEGAPVGLYSHYEYTPALGYR